MKVDHSDYIRCHSCPGWAPRVVMNDIGLCPMCLLSMIKVPSNPLFEADSPVCSS